MIKNNIDKLIEALKDQEEIFGGLLLNNEKFRKLTVDFPAALPNKAQNGDNGGVIMQSELKSEGFYKAGDLNALRDFMLECHKCPLAKTRQSLVFGSGSPEADVMVIGEAPGADEDEQGLPFVGRAGKLLTDILKAINFSREEVYITNVVKCRPPGNRNPLPEEMTKCIPYLDRQIELIKPKMILCLGLIAAQGVLNQKLSLGKMRGNVYDRNGVRAMVTYHPAALLRNPNWKKDTWEDVQKFRKLYDELKAGA